LDSLNPINYSDIKMANYDEVGNRGYRSACLWKSADCQTGKGTWSFTVLVFLESKEVCRNLSY